MIMSALHTVVRPTSVPIEIWNHCLKSAAKQKLWLEYVESIHYAYNADSNTTIVVCVCIVKCKSEHPVLPTPTSKFEPEHLVLHGKTF